MKLRLVFPNRKYLNSFIAASREGRPSRADHRPKITMEYIKHMRAAARGLGLANGEVARTEYWLVDGKRYLGRIQIRHKPSGSHPAIKSHIYYEIRSRQRGKGYGTNMLALGLAKARKLGMKRLIAACDESNAASRQVIEKNGGARFASKHDPARSETTILYRLETTPRKSRQKS